jgi:TolA-binding protein
MSGSMPGHRYPSRTSSVSVHLACASFLILALGLPLSGCLAKRAESPDPAPQVTASRAELERRVARLELALLEKEAQVEDLQKRLDQAREEVVRAMAKLQIVASRAEAASGMAEAEVALQLLKSRSGQVTVPEAAQATRLLREASAEFNLENYGGTLYLATQAKSIAAAGTARLSARDRTPDRPGEKPFAVPIPLKAVGTANVREGPATSAPVVFAIEAGVNLTGYSYVEDWVRISDDTGRGGWVFRKLVARR